MTARPQRLRSVSMRARVLLAVLVVLAVTMVAAGLVVATVAKRQTAASADQLLTSRMQLAKQLVQQNLTARQLVNRVDAQGVRATLTLSDGSQLGLDPVPGPQRSTILTGGSRLDGAKLVLTVDTALLDRAHRTLIRALVITGLIALAVGALLALLATRLALAPLRQMASTARRIAGGHRGIRLNPARADTDVGQTATAIDAMLDALEGAEHRALESERRTRDFLADATHELRTPFAGISTSAETLLHQSLSPQQREQLLVLLVREAHRGSRLVNDLLVVAGLAAGPAVDRVPTDITAVATEELHRLGTVQPGLRVELSGPATQVFADPAALHGILRNLLDNAARACGPDGRIVVTVRSGEPVLIDVADSGPGVPLFDRERIFDRLVRLDSGRGRADGGSGLGLAIARGHARAAGGDLVCVSTDAAAHPLPGALFRLSLQSAAQATKPSIR